MTNIIASSARVTEHRAGPVVVVVFAGEYPEGSSGNACARQMASYLDSVIGEAHPAAVLLDFIDLDYTYGDAICGLARSLRVAGTRFRPSAIVATGATAQALAPLLGPNWLFGIAGTKMFGSVPEAVAYLEGMLAQETG